MNISASELKNSFVRICFSLFQGKGLFLYLTASCLLYLMLQKKNTERSFWRGYGAFLLLIVYNPLIVWYPVAKFNLDSEYYRFLWLIPIPVIIAYVGTSITMNMKKTWKLGCLVGVMLVIVGCGSTIFSRSMEKIENVYKIPDEVIEVCEIIRADSNEAEPCVAADFDLDVLMNQYAPDIRLILNYREIAKIREFEAQGDIIDSAAKRLYYVLIAGEEYDYAYTEGYLDYALEEGEVDYIVTERGNPARTHVDSSQCRLIAELEKYCIYRVELEEET